MREFLQFYIGGAWVEPAHSVTLDVVNPATDQVYGRVAMGSEADVDRAVEAARGAFAAWSATSRQERLDVLARVLEVYQSRFGDLASAVTQEMGAPAVLSQSAQVPAGMAHLAIAKQVLEHFVFEEPRGETRILREAIGVCALITPWNWPLNQMLCKIAPALATGCTMVLKPSETAPFSSQILAEIIHDAGVPPGVFNLVNGDGAGVGAALCRHPDVDMVSFTGSTRAGVEVATAAAASVKRVAQELGGKSANIVLDDAAFGASVAAGVQALMVNSGQSCNAPSRMLVPAARMDEAAAAARAAVDGIKVGDPTGNATMGPVANQVQWSKIQSLIQLGIDEGAVLVVGGVGRPDDLQAGSYVRPTVFAHVDNTMTIAREEIFGPVLCILGYDDLDHAVRLANDTPYGLAGYVSGQDLVQARAVAGQIKAGQVSVNGANDLSAPFGGYKQSGNGREWGDHGFQDFLETKAILGYGA